MAEETNAFETVRYELADHILTITINRPDRRNALNRTAYRELEQAFRAAQRDPEVRCVVLTGADPAFCAGEDVKEMMTGEEHAASVATLTAVRPKPTPAAMAVLECDRPVIAAVNGAAVGWGMELSLFADIRIASEKAKFGEIFIKRGLISDIGGLGRLPSLVGASKAAELLFTGDIISGEEAARIGLASKCVAHEALMDEARAMAERIAVNPPLALRFMKEGLRRAAHQDYDELGNWVSGTLGRLFQTEDHREGVKSFLEKREPQFVGR